MVPVSARDPDAFHVAFANRPRADPMTSPLYSFGWKAPLAASPYQFDVSDWLAGDTIASAHVSAVNPPGLSISGIEVSSPVINLIVSGGKSATRYAITLTVSSVGGRSNDFAISLSVVDVGGNVELVLNDGLPEQLQQDLLDLNAILTLQPGSEFPYNFHGESINIPLDYVRAWVIAQLGGVSEGTPLLNFTDPANASLWAFRGRIAGAFIAGATQRVVKVPSFDFTSAQNAGMWGFRGRPVGPFMAAGLPSLPPLAVPARMFYAPENYAMWMMLGVPTGAPVLDTPPPPPPPSLPSGLFFDNPQNAGLWAFRGRPAGAFVPIA